MLGLGFLKLENERKKCKENRLFDNSSPSILRINWQMAKALKNKWHTCTSYTHVSVF